MAFSVDLDMSSGIAKMTLAGQLDASVAPMFQSEVEKAAAQQAKRLVLLMKDLNFMASAGLRSLVFAKQKMGPALELYVVGAQPQVMAVIHQAGFDRSIIALPEYDAEEIEKA